MNTLPSPDDIISALANPVRWSILRELARGEPLPVVELARRLGWLPANLSKHALILLRMGLVERGYGLLYRIPARFVVSGEPATLDLGLVVLRLDRLDVRAGVT